MVRLTFDVGGRATPEELRQSLFAQLRSEIQPHNADETEAPEPVVELTLRGHLGFKNSLLEINQIRDEIKSEFNPLLSIVRNQTLPVEYAVAVGLSEHVSRGERERRVIEDLITRDARFRDQAESMAGLILETKRLALDDEEPVRIAELIEHGISPRADANPAT
ncbi:MAG: hypothetical protein IPG76_03510 [Acidobacteria bacterium]|nr:hypothetical protein [Acidobacteriota bacterium]